MKLSIAWIFEHIKTVNWHKINLEELVAKFNQITAEIEHCENLILNPESFTIVEILAENRFFSAELNLNLELPPRANLKIGELYLVYKKNSNYSWASLADLGSAKDGLLTTISCAENLRAGSWKDKIIWQDVILEIDNKSITHRPDLWGHRGIAREITVIYDFELKDLNEFITKIPIAQVSSKDLDNSTVKLVTGCHKFSSYLINYTENPATDLNQAFMLARLDQKPIKLLVDLTNYVMLDLGQPMHAFDADKLILDSVNVRYARAGEQLELLDDQRINLLDSDLVITSGDQPVSLGAIMGGKNSAISNSTSRVLLEAANFDAGIIRRTAVRLKLRTEASARFEKSLAPEQTELAIERYLKLLTDLKINYQAARFINSSIDINKSGENSDARVIEISHDFIEQRLGLKLKPEFIANILTKLGFNIIQKLAEPENILTYVITVPGYRVTKDISLPEDIVEEIGRFYGYDNIPAQLPVKVIVPFNNARVYNLRKIKQLLATAGHMHEVNSYPFFDEQFLRDLQWQPAENSYIQVDSPVSENWHRLVTSLVPHLVKAVYQNLNTGTDYFNFFECNKIWLLETQQTAQELFSLSGIVATTKINRKNLNNNSFYELKNILTQLFKLLKLEISWELIQTTKLDNLPAWYDQAQAVLLTHKINNKFNKIGLVGKLNAKFWSNLADTELDGLIFELDLDYLLNYVAPTETFVPSAKYQVNYLDVTVLAAQTLTMAQLTMAIKTAHDLILAVELIDSFTKPEWLGQRALTFRYKFVDPQKNLVKAEIEQIQLRVTNALKNLGVEIR